MGNKVYELTKGFPVGERHVLTAQIRRAALSLTANLAEGFDRFSHQENVQYCCLARGSAFEVCDHLTTALDTGDLSQKGWSEIDALAQRTIQILNGYMRSTRALQKPKGAQ